jgi:hypothetical protein
VAQNVVYKEVFRNLWRCLLIKNANYPLWL